MSPPPVPPRTAAIAFILLTAMLDVMSMGIVIPVVPQLIEELPELPSEVLHFFVTQVSTPRTFL